MTSKFSILVPSIISRVEKYLVPLYGKLKAQVDSCSSNKKVEILSLVDDCTRSVGFKRDALVQAAVGDYLAFVDDDDDVSEDYVSSILEALENNPGVDLVVFNQGSSINDENLFTVKFGIEFENQEAYKVGDTWADVTRKPFHVCVWKSTIAKKYRFPNCSYGEDWYWAERALKEVKTQARIDKILHFYRFSDTVTRAADRDYPDKGFPF